MVCERESTWQPTDLSIYTLIYSFSKYYAPTTCQVLLLRTLKNQETNFLLTIPGRNGENSLKELEKNAFFFFSHILPFNPKFWAGAPFGRASFLCVLICHFFPFSPFLLKSLWWMELPLPCLPGCDTNKLLNWQVAFASWMGSRYAPLHGI